MLADMKGLEQSSDMRGDNIHGEVEQVQVRLVTKLPQQVPENQLFLPQDIQREGLSQLVNHLLGQDTSVDYDFLLNGCLLSTSISEAMATSSTTLTSEQVLTLEYLHMMPSPDPITSQTHPDWISAIQISPFDNMLYTACYDQRARIYHASSPEPMSIFSGHTAPIKSICIVSRTRFLTGSRDRCIRLWDPSRPDAIAIGKGHTESVDAVAISPDTSHMASGSADSTIRIWKEVEGKVPAKRRKGKKGSAGVLTPAELVCLASLGEGHRQSVTDLVWVDPSILLSCSWDRSVIAWDVNGQRPTSTWLTPDSISAMAISGEPGRTLLATAHCDRRVRLHDWRMAGQPGQKPAQILFGHQAWVSSVCWRRHQLGEYHLASASHDRTVRIWDRRSVGSPLHILESDVDQLHGKTLALDWGINDVIACGGTDGKCRIHQIQ